MALVEGILVRCGGRGHSVLSPGGARPPVIWLHATKT